MSTSPLEPEDALAATLSAARPKLHRYCARMVGSVFDAEDIVQDVLIIAQEKLLKTDVANTEAWLMRVTHNRSIDHLRAQARRKTVPLDDLDLTVTDRSTYDAQEIAEVALSVFLQISPLQRACVIMKDILGYTLAEIADMLEDQTLGSVKSALNRGRSNLKRRGAQTAEEQTTPLAPEAVALLRLYAKRFQERDVSGIRKMLLDDVRLDLVAVVRAQGKDALGKYFGNYRALDHLELHPGQCEGQPAIWVDDGQQPFIILLELRAGRVAGIRDFHFARYVTENIHFRTL